MHWLGLAITAVVLWVFGRVLTDMGAAGQWWIFPLWFAGIFAVIYRIGTDEDRAYYTRFWAKIIGRPAHAENREERRALEELHPK